MPTYLTLLGLRSTTHCRHCDRQDRYSFDIETSHAVPPTSVPEPASILGLLTLGALGATSLKRKQKEEA
ncbi:MAG: PEP-CTERM sorting domain-containing protein [Microcoleaceae cyanobacterium]